MTGTLDQASGMVEELIRHPFKRDAAVRTAVVVGKHLLTLPYSKKTPSGQFETPAAGVGEFIQPAKQQGKHRFTRHGRHPAATVPGCNAAGRE